MLVEDKILFDIANAARLITEFMGGMSRETFDTDYKTQSAVLHQLMILGEVSKLLPEAVRLRHSEIPWQQIARMRDRLIHHYFNLDLDIVWQTATVDIPALQTYVRPFVTPLLSEDEVI